MKSCPEREDGFGIPIFHDMLASILKKDMAIIDVSMAATVLDTNDNNQPSKHQEVAFHWMIFYSLPCG